MVRISWLICVLGLWKQLKYRLIELVARPLQSPQRLESCLWDALLSIFELCLLRFKRVISTHIRFLRAHIRDQVLKDSLPHVLLRLPVVLNFPVLNELHLASRVSILLLTSYHNQRLTVQLHAGGRPFLLNFLKPLTHIVEVEMGARPLIIVHFFLLLRVDPLVEVWVLTC